MVVIIDYTFSLSQDSPSHFSLKLCSFHSPGDNRVSKEVKLHLKFEFGCWCDDLNNVEKFRGQYVFFQILKFCSNLFEYQRINHTKTNHPYNFSSFEILVALGVLIVESKFSTYKIWKCEMNRIPMFQCESESGDTVKFIEKKPTLVFAYCTFPVQNVVFGCTILLPVAMAFERYRAIK